MLWHRSLGRIENYHGAAGSPLVYKGRVILYQVQAAGSFIAAFDARTGADVWRTRRNASVGWGTPIAIRVAGHDEIIVNRPRRVVAYDPGTGRELWHCDGSTYEVIPTPVVGDGMVYCASGRAGPTLAIRAGGRGDVTRTHVAWTSPRGAPFVPSPILYDKYLYSVNDTSSIVTALEATTGRTMWQGRLGVARREGFSASPVAVDGKLFFTNHDGETFVLRAGPTFELLHVNRIGEHARVAGTCGRPVVHPDRPTPCRDRPGPSFMTSTGHHREPRSMHGRHGMPVPGSSPRSRDVSARSAPGAAVEGGCRRTSRCA